MWSMYQLGRLYLDQDLQQSLSYLLRAINLNVDNAKVWKEYGDALLLTLLASVVILFSLNNLFMKPLRLNLKLDFYWQLIFGSFAGIIGGLTSIVGIISAMYLAMLNLKPKEFIDGSGFLIFIGCFSVGMGYIVMGVIEPFMIGPSLFGTFMAFLGFKLGAFIRKFVSPDNFYKILWIIFLVTGFRLAMTAVSKF